MAKPTDFFVSITDLFSIVLPGAALAFVAIGVERNRGHDVLGLLKMQGTEGYVAFAVVAYLLGHSIDLIGAWLLDPIYDLTYAHWKRREKISFFDWIVASPARLVVECKRWLTTFVVWSESPRRSEDVLLQKARLLAEYEKPAGINVYKWCRTWLTLKNAAATNEIDRLQAASKFFRGMVSVTAITCICCFVYGYPFAITGGLACLLLSVGSFVRYCDLRWKAVQQTYAFFIAMHSRKFESTSRISSSTEHE